MKKDDILETAVRLFAEHGYVRTSTALLAAKAGVAEGTIFRHFKTKEQIFVTLIERLHTRMTNDVCHYIDSHGKKEGLERIILIIRGCHFFVQKNDVDFALLLRDAPGHYSDEEGLPFKHSRFIYTFLHDNFMQAIEQGQKNNTIRHDLHPSDTACLMASCLVGLVRAQYFSFLEPSENILENFIVSVTAMCEVK